MKFEQKIFENNIFSAFQTQPENSYITIFYGVVLWAFKSAFQLELH